ncbi:cryptochrome/photolyase family protein [Devriesea agamarum]|uniref:cryptochrome/photolyase family protein n=1 Tax=Devriesea agamarum TaxID=472569 RepID=UPI00071D341F|nr:deoxyribodipyrimidine photo-lyase [Devriesea agamarum]
MTTIWWIRDDLRLHDNLALSAAADDEVIAVHLAEDIPGARELGAASRWWLHHSLSALATDLRELGIPLVLAAGNAEQVIPDLVAACDATRITWSRRYHEPRRDVDTRVKHSLRGQGIAADSYGGYLLREPWTVMTRESTPFRVFSAYARAHRGANPLRLPCGLPKNLRGPQNLGKQVAGRSLHQWLAKDIWSESLEMRGYCPRKPDWSHGLRQTWQPGEAGARQRLRHLDRILDTYADDRDHPYLDGTSRLSAHLRFGEISPHEVWHQVHGQGRGPETFRSELLWREFAWHRLYHLPHLATQNVRPEFDRYPWSDDPAVFRAWTRAQTGIPLVDAGMRELWVTGTMHNRVRMVTASFLVKNLQIHWRRGEEWFWDTLVDADEASNPFNWQWVAGSGDDAAPYFRIFNPQRQRERFDPQDLYVRRWLPHLGTDDYPDPIVDLASSRREALEAYQNLRG